MKNFGKLEKVTPINISGWVVDKEVDCPTVDIFLNDLFVSSVKCSVLRQDVVKAYGEVNKYNGFLYSLPINKGDVVHVTINGSPLKSSPAVADGHMVSGKVLSIDALSRKSPNVEKICSQVDTLCDDTFPTVIYKINKGKVNPNGVVFVDGFCVKESLSLFNEKKGGVISEDKELFSYPYSDVVKLDGSFASLAMFGANNYYHFLFDLILRAVLFESEKVELGFDSYLISKFERDFQNEVFSRIFKFSPVFLTEGALHSFEIMYFMHPVRRDYFYNKKSLSILAAKLKDTFISENSNEAFGDKIYLSREFQNGRKLVNEADLAAKLHEAGFQIIYPEKLSLAQQANLFSKANIIISCSGAALSNLIYCKSNTMVVEIIPDSTSNRQTHVFWQNFCSSVGVKHFGFYSSVYEKSKNIHSEKYIIDVDAFLSFFYCLDKDF